MQKRVCRGSLTRDLVMPRAHTDSLPRVRTQSPENGTSPGSTERGLMWLSGKSLGAGVALSLLMQRVNLHFHSSLCQMFLSLPLIIMYCFRAVNFKWQFQLIGTYSSSERGRRSGQGPLPPQPTRGLTPTRNQPWQRC
jgi:hypothetical protein